jgi:hypothetical protein
MSSVTGKKDVNLRFVCVSSIIALVLTFLVAFCDLAPAADLLTGDTRLACEAILCLSSPARPGECSPSLDRYFGIKKKKWKDTVKARRNFLNKCPSSTESDVMLSLSRAISYGAGKCGASQLNARGRWIEQVSRTNRSNCSRDNGLTSTKGTYEEFYRWEQGDADGPSYCEKVIRYWLVDTTPPGYCTDLWDHENTYYVEGPHLIHGLYPWETRWAE